MLELRGGVDLANEPPAAELGGELRAHDLHGHAAAVAQVAREVDRGHAAAPELALHLVRIAQRVPQRCERRRVGGR